MNVASIYHLTICFTILIHLQNVCAWHKLSIEVHTFSHHFLFYFEWEVSSPVLCMHNVYKWGCRSLVFGAVSNAVVEKKMQFVTNHWGLPLKVSGSPQCLLLCCCVLEPAVAWPQRLEGAGQQLALGHMMVAESALCWRLLPVTCWPVAKGASWLSWSPLDCLLYASQTPFKTNMKGSWSLCRLFFCLCQWWFATHCSLSQLFTLWTFHTLKGRSSFFLSDWTIFCSTTGLLGD